MLYIEVPLENEKWDENKQEFIEPKKQILKLEHSLVSLSKWESIYHKPFLSNAPKTDEETITYVRCMTITQNVPLEVYSRLSDQNIIDINSYIDDPMTATKIIKQPNGKQNFEPITSELIYYWMFELKIPMECQKWHLNKLLTQIELCSIKNQPPKKMSKQEITARNAAINAQRRREMNTKG